MLILCYGMAKSGSTLTFELVKGMLESTGHTQIRLPDGVVNAGHIVNFAEPIDRERVDALIDAVGQRWIAVKTHAGFRPLFFPRLEELQLDGKLRIIASYRDPRDLCLSLLDAGEQARKRGEQTFSPITGMDVAINHADDHIEKFRRWASVRGTLRLDYETVAFSPDIAIDEIERHLGIACDRDAAKRHAFEGAFTQQNKMKSRRFETDLTDAEKARLTEAFNVFIREVCETQDDGYFTSHRDEILRRAERAARKHSRT